MLILINRGKSNDVSNSNPPALRALFKLKPLKNERRKCQKMILREKLLLNCQTKKINQKEDYLMKSKNLVVWFTMLAVVLVMSAGQILAQTEDTLVVNWDDGAGNIVQDALYNAVMGDTAADGSRANLNRVYKLKAGGYYWNNKTISNDFPLRLVGEVPTGDEHPAVIQMVTDAESGSTPGKMISCASDLTLKNLYIIGSDELGSSGYYQPIEVNAVAKRFIFDNCVFERSNFAIVAFAGGKDNDLFITNCVYRNLQEDVPTQQWCGRGLSVWTDIDTVVIENNTFFNINMCAIQIENGAANYLRFNHNTLVNIGRAFTSTTNVWWREAYFTNLLFVNTWWHGEGYCDYSIQYQPGRDPRAYTTGQFPVLDMPSRYGTNKGRRILFSNTAAYLDPFFTTHYGDTIRTQPYVNAITDSFFTTFSPDNGGQMVIKDTTWLSAKPTFSSDPNTPAQLEAMWNHITASRGYQYYGTGIQAKPYYYGLVTEGTDTLWAEPAWPLPENFTYTDDLTDLSTDGLPLGDLRWFPAAKTTFEANKDSYVNAIEWMPGERIIIKPIWEEQAEAGTVGGTAAIEPFTGEAWYTLQGGTSVEWTFNSPNAVAYDIKFKARADGQNIGFDFLVNGEHVVDALHGWGQFVVWTDGNNGGVDFWSDRSTSEFYEAEYTNTMLKNNDVTGNLSLKAGENTLKLQYSWNAISFQWIEFYEAGTTNLIARLEPSAAVNNGATPGGIGDWVPQGFNSVALGTNGTVTFNLPNLDAGRYQVRVFYQNAGSAKTGKVLVDGAEATTFSFASQPAGTGLDVITDLFDLTAGTHTLAISGSGVKVDWIQLLNESRFSGIKKAPVPDGFALSQNYPNPFNPTTMIRFELGKPSNVKLTVYNLLGQRVATLVNGHMSQGAHIIQFDASHLASGIYFYAIQAGEFKEVKRMLLLK